MVMVRLAIETLPGTDVDSAYSAGLAYQREIAAAQDQNGRNWKVDALIQRGPGGGVTLQVEARDETGKPVTGLMFQGRFERPTDRRADQTMAFAEIGSGIYRSRATLIAPGQWDLVLEGDASGQRMFLSKNRVSLN
jgi:nitrogen fixation protein FixH